MTGGRVLRLEKELNEYDEFMLTYGDGLSDINLNKLYDFHTKNNCIGTVTAVHPPARFGLLDFDNNLVKNLRKNPKPMMDGLMEVFLFLKKPFLNIYQMI